jgi:Carboxypeptidase regulatory-like domain
VAYGGRGEQAGGGPGRSRYAAPSDKDAMSWNHDNAVLAASFIAVDGYLPAGKVTAGPPNVHIANQPPHAIAGFVTDCSGAPMPGVPVHAAKARTTTNARGFYLLRMPKAGHYVVVATGGGATLRRRVHIS